MRRFLVILMFIVASSGAVFLLNKDRSFELAAVNVGYDKTVFELPGIPEATPPKEDTEVVRPETKKNSDAEPQKKLAEPPQVIKAVYATSWSAGTPSRINYLTDLIKTTELNAIVIDIKDYSGNVTYNTEVEEVKKYGAREIRIPRINSLIKKLHEDNIYVIGRVTVFQDPILAAARPDLAIKNKTTGKIWTDRKGLGWIDPGSKEYWDYIVKIAKDAEARGIDEINFDYIRFPSDGDLSEMVYQFYDEKKERKEDVIAEFFRYLRFNLKDEKISADLFGLATIQKDDLGIGQVIESAYASFDYVSPMVYPSHYAAGFLGYKNPTNFPYEVVKYSMEKAEEKFLATGLTTSKLRPWLQDFDLGANYGPTEVKAQFKALADAGVENGWMLWDPSNVYTKEALILN